MTSFHEAIRVVLQDTEKFLSTHLKKDKISKKSRDEGDRILKAIDVIRKEFPSLHLEPLEADTKPVLVTTEGTQLFDAGDYVYTDQSAQVDGPAGEQQQEVYEECSSGQAGEALSPTHTKSNTTLDKVDAESNVSDEYGDMRPGTAAVPAQDLVLEASKSGWLEKKRKKESEKKGKLGGFLAASMAKVNPYQRRWCVLKDTTFYYYEKQLDTKQCGQMDIAEYEARETPESKKTGSFQLVKPGGRTYMFMASSKEDMNEWIAAIEKISKAIPPSPSKEDLIMELDTDEEYEDPNESARKPSQSSSTISTDKAMDDDIYDDTAAGHDDSLDDIYEDTEPPPLPAANEVIKPTQNASPEVTFDDIYDDTDEVTTVAAEDDDIYDECMSAIPQEKAPAPPGTLPLNKVPSTEEAPPSPEAYLKPLPSFRKPGQKGIIGDIDFENVYMGLWDCKVDDEDELEFKRGDLIYIINKDYDGYSWWVGQLTSGKLGLVPKAYLMPAYEEITS